MQQKKIIINLSIVLSILMCIIAVSLYATLNPLNNYKNIVNAQCFNNAKVLVGVNFIASKAQPEQTQFDLQTKLPSNNKWQSVINKSYNEEYASASTKPIIFNKALGYIFYAYKITLISDDNGQCNYDVNITGVDNQDIKIYVGNFSLEGFNEKDYLQGILEATEQKEFFIVFASEQSINEYEFLSQQKEVNIQIKVNKI